jgi:hypothetical protein
MSQSNQHIEIVPSNVTSDGSLSFHNGQPVISFIIGEQDRYLLGSSLRLSGRFEVMATDVLAGSTNAQLNMDGRTGLYSTIDQLVIKSQATNQVIEHIRDYNRFMSSYLASTNDLGDGLSHLGTTALEVLNASGMKNAVVDSAYTTDAKPQSFCLSLPSGFLSGTNAIPLARDWGVGGLLIEIHLSPDNNVLFADNGTGTDISNAFYQYKDVALIAEVQTPSPSDLSSLRSGGSSGNTFEYNSISSYYTTFNSTNAIINFSLGLSRVLSVFCNFITSTNINNRSFNGMTTYYPKKADDTVGFIKQVIFTAGGQRMPLDYNIDTLQKDHPTNQSAQSQIYRNYVNSVQSFSKNMRNMASPENSVMTPLLPSLSYERFIDGGANIGVGVAFDTISNQGLDFRTTQFGIQMDTDLTDNSPQSVYMFVKSKNTLVFNPQGIQVIT